MLTHLLAGAYSRFCFIGLFFLGGFLLESIAPAGKVTLRERVFNCTCGMLYLITDIFCAFYLISLLSPLLRHPLIQLTVGDHHQFVFGFVLAFLWVSVRDFFYYWFHRWQHYSRWMWAEHALHHSDPHMNVTTAIRHHWLEMPLNTIFVTVPLYVLFKPPAITIPSAYAFVYLVGYLIHCNVRLGAGPLAKIVVSPHNHHIHHSREPQHRDKNFAQLFPMWDVLFGTYYAPDRDEFPETGLSSGETVDSLKDAALLPFQSWGKMLAAHFDRRNLAPQEPEPQASAGIGD